VPLLLSLKYIPQALERLSVRDEAAVDAVLRAAWGSAGPAALPAALDAESDGSSEEETDEQENEDEEEEEEREEQDGTPPPLHKRLGAKPLLPLGCHADRAAPAPAAAPARSDRASRFAEIRSFHFVLFARSISSYFPWLTAEFDAACAGSAPARVCLGGLKAQQAAMQQKHAQMAAQMEAEPAALQVHMDRCSCCSHKDRCSCCLHLTFQA